MYRKIKDMIWPVPCDRMGDVEWQLRYGEPNKETLLTAASIIFAYRQMICDTQKKRKYIVSELRMGPNIASKKRTGK